VELGCVARPGGRDFLDLRSGEEEPKHCTSMRTEETLRALDDLIRERSILQHPFYRAWKRGELTRDQLATYSRVYYPHVAAFPTYLENAINCEGDPFTRRDLEANLHDELMNPAPHPELWLDFAEATGQDREGVKRAQPVAKVARTVSTFDRLTNHDIASGLTALYAYESQQPDVAAEKMRGLRKSYGIQSNRALSYFMVHATADLEHRAGERRALARCLNNCTSADTVISAANEALDAYWNLLDGVCEDAHLRADLC
jgi:pyrroloquinoline-quinone synthase